MTASSATREFDLRELMKLAEPPRRRTLLPLVVAALAAHAAVALLPRSASPSPSAAQEPVAVEIQLSQAAPVPEPEPEPEPGPDQPESAPPAERAPAQTTRALAPASAGAVLTAAADSQSVDPAEPFDFTSDPNHQFGVGVVAVGGRAPRGLTGARAVASAGGARGAQALKPTRTRGTGLTKLSDLSRVPRLPARNPCQGYFPASATNDRATALVRVVVGKGGAVSSAAIVSESPSGQGFGAAARTCMSQQHFTPALDRAGQPAATAVVVNVRFAR